MSNLSESSVKPFIGFTASGIHFSLYSLPLVLAFLPLPHSLSLSDAITHQMGCGGSKLNDDGTTLPSRLRPIFLLRFEEITRRIRTSPALEAATATAPSQKELLVDSGEDYEVPSNHQPHKSLSSPHRDDHGLTRSQGQGTKAEQEKTTKEASEEERRSTTATAVNDETNKKQALDKERSSSALACKNNSNNKHETMNANAVERDAEDGEEEDVEEGSLNHDEGDGICPGSPSFRVYFGEDNMHDDDKSDCDEYNRNACKDGGLNNSTQIGHAASASSKESVKKKVHKRKSSFRKVIPKGGQAAVKNLFNVRSLYSSTNSGQDRTQLPTGKKPC